MLLLIIPLVVGVLSILVALYLFIDLTQETGTSEMAEVGSYIALGVKTYLSRQLRTILLIAPLLGVVILIFSGWATAATFLLGVFTSLATAFLGMNAVIRANIRTAERAVNSTQRAFYTAVFGGAIMGFSITGFSLVTLSILYAILRTPEPLVGFGFGASLAALFAQIGGGIYTKAADIGADIVGKVERNIPEDDPRNPAVIADLVGDNVGDCAGRGSDLFESFSDDIITGMILSLLFVGRYGPLVMFLPLVLQSVGLVASLLGVLAVRQLKKLRPAMAFNVGMLIVAGVAGLGAFLVARFWLDDLGIFVGSALGILTMLLASFVTRYYAGARGKPVRDIAEASKRGPALNLITGFASGLQSPLVPVLMIVFSVSVAYIVSGGSMLAVVAVNIGTDLMIAYIMTADAFGPITDNAAGIAEMSAASRSVVRSLSSLDAVGNTMKATTKAYAMSSGTITSFVLFATYFDLVDMRVMDISTPFSVAFIFLGISMPYLISSLVIGSTARTALKVVDEVRRQFQHIDGLLAGKVKPDYAACVDISTKSALREMILPGLVSVAVPVIVGIAFGSWALGAFLVGAVAAAALLGSFFNNVGTAFDNAKKVIEDAGHRGSFEHQAAVVGDTVGDPLKDVAGPSLLIFMKLVGMAALLLADVVR